MSYATFKGGTPALVRLFVSIVLTALSAVVLAASLVSDVDAHFQLLRLLLLIVTDVKFFCFMSIGVVFALHHQGRSNLVQLTGRAGFLLAMCFLLWGCDNALENPGQPFTLMWSYLLALGIFSVCYGLSNKFSVSPALIQKLASVSFPLYIVHMSVGFFIMRLLHAHGYAPLPATGLAFCVVLALSYVIHVGVEVPFHRLGRRLARQLDEQPSQFVDRALKRADGLQGPL